MAAPIAAPICHFKMGSSWCNRLFLASATYLALLSSTSSTLQRWFLTACMFFMQSHLRFVNVSWRLSVLACQVWHSSLSFNGHVKKNLLSLLECFPLCWKMTRVFWFQLFFVDVFMSLNVIIGKVSNVVITTHWVHLSWTSIIGFKFCTIMHVMCTVLCGLSSAKLSYFKQVARYVSFILLLMQSCWNAAKTPCNANAGKKTKQFNNIKTHLSWFGIFTYRGFVGRGQLGRIVIHIKDPDADYRVRHHNMVIWRRH